MPLGLLSPTQHPQQVEGEGVMEESRRAQKVHTHSCSEENRWSASIYLSEDKKGEWDPSWTERGDKEGGETDENSGGGVLREWIPESQPNLLFMTPPAACALLVVWPLCMCACMNVSALWCSCLRVLIVTYSQVEHGKHRKRGMSWEEGFPVEGTYIPLIYWMYRQNTCLWVMCVMQNLRNVFQLIVVEGSKDGPKKQIQIKRQLFCWALEDMCSAECHSTCINCFFFTNLASWTSLSLPAQV